MKAARSKPSEKPAGNALPFFSKENGQDFFGGPATEPAFFAGNPTISAIQPKLTIGQPGDKYEQEADAMADKVVQRSGETGTTQPKPASTPVAITPLVQAKCATCQQAEEKKKEEEDKLKDKKLQRKPVAAGLAEPPTDATAVQRKCPACEEEEEEKLQRKENGTPVSNPTTGIETGLAATKGSGSPLPATTRREMETSFGADFSQVRIHSGSTAGQLNRQLNAQAFTHGKDIYFNSGRYDTSGKGGKHLLAHELTHVVQQGGSNGKVQRQDEPSTLQKLDDALNQFDVPEEDVITLCSQLNETEKATVLAGGYKERMAGALDFYEMQRAVTHLNPKLKVKLEWINASATFTSSIAYSDIQAWVTAAPQPERDELKTDDWKSFFVDVCDNSTIITAVTELKFDLKTQLEWIEAESSITSWAFAYADVQPLVTAASQPDRDALKTDTWRDFFVAICDNVTIITAVTDLKYDLKTQLEWVQAEATFSSWAFAYVDVQPLVTAASQPDRDVLKTDTWRDFFVAICDNETIADAVIDLKFDLKTQLEWLIAEGSSYDPVKKVINAAGAPEKATVLADTAFLRTLMGYFFWWDNFAKTVELLGRSCPSAGTLLGDATVQGALSSAWAASGAALTTPGTPAPATVHEEGGYIYMNLVTGGLSTSSASPGAQASLPLNDPDPPAECITVGGFHTHPNVGPSWGAPFASPEDISWATRNGIPLLIRGAFPTVAATSDTSTGSGRLHLAGGTGFPGATGGVAPQADLENRFDAV